MQNIFSIKNLQRVLPRLYGLLPFYLNPKYAFSPLHAYFEVTYRCNLRCDMCHFLEVIEETETRRKFHEELSAPAIIKAIAALPRFTVLTFTGGEAFLKNDFMEILQFATARNKVHIITNGTVLDSPLVDRLLDLPPASFLGPGLFFIGVSLQGEEGYHDRTTASPGSFRQARKGLQRLLELRGESRYPLVHVTCVIRKDNVSDLVALYDDANELGVDVFNLVLHSTATYPHVKGFNLEDKMRTPPAPVSRIEPGLLREQLDQLAEKSQSVRCQLRFSPNGITLDEIVRYYSNQSSHRDYRCYAAWSKVGVSAYGDVFSCPHYRVGALGENGHTIPWNGMRHQEFRQMVKKEKIFPGCLGCCQSEYVGPA